MERVFFYMDYGMMLLKFAAEFVSSTCLVSSFLNQSEVSALKLDALFLPIGWIESDGESEELIVCGASAFIPLGPIWLEKSWPGIIPANEILYKIE
jgi:hypothetical protein